jgi:hypothetical protein
MAAKIATKVAVGSMSVSCEQFTPSRLATGNSGAVRSKNTINADLGHYPSAARNRFKSLSIISSSSCRNSAQQLKSDYTFGRVFECTGDVSARTQDDS